jgi:signal transduction histidine kinase
LHFAEFLSPSARFHQISLGAIVAGFGILTIAAFCFRRRGVAAISGVPTGIAYTARSEWIALACLLLFTSSFLHFGYEHGRSPWAAEVAWHHVGIPVALIVLLQDYRFLLLDTFIRFLINSALAATYVAALLVLNHRFHLWNAIFHSAFLTGIALVALCLSLICFAYLRNGLQTWVSRFVFRRNTVDACANAIAKLASSATSEKELLGPAAAEIARHLSAAEFAVVAEVRDREPLVRPSIFFGEQNLTEPLQQRFRAEAQIPLRFSSGDAGLLVLGARRGGRRYLSEDLEDMRVLGAVIVEQVERFRAEELKRLASQAELRALQAQINPHFFFNALNTLYGTIDRKSYAARRLVLNLADVFRYFLQGERTMIPLSEELHIVEAYLEIEALRLGDRLETELEVSESAGRTHIPVLSIQPLVENAVKHGIAAKAGRGRVSVKAIQTAAGLRIVIQDSGPGFDNRRAATRNGAGLGLENVRRRLELCYGPAGTLDIESSDAGTKVAFTVPKQFTAAEIRPQVSVEV